MTAQTALTLLLHALEDGDAAVRRDAVITLGERRAQEAVQPLIAMLMHRREDDQVRAEAAEALGKIGDPRAIETLVALVGGRYLHSDKDTTDAGGLRRAALNALAALGSAAIEPLGDLLLKTRQPLTQQEIIWTLRKIGDQRAVPYLLNRLLSSRDADVVSACERVITSLGAAEALVEPMIELVRDSQGTWFHHRAVEFLARLGDQRAVPYLLEAFKNCDNTFDVIAIQQALKRLEGASPQVIQTIMEKLNDADSRWFHAAGAQFLAEAGVSEAVPNLLNALRLSTRQADMLTIYRALIDLGAGDELIDVLIEKLQNDDQQPFHATAAALLASLNAQRAIPTILKAMQTCDNQDDLFTFELALQRLGHNAA